MVWPISSMIVGWGVLVACRYVAKVWRRSWMRYEPSRPATVRARFQALHPHGYGLIEHLPVDKVPLANANVRRIAAEHEVPIV